METVTAYNAIVVIAVIALIPLVRSLRRSNRELERENQLARAALRVQRNGSHQDHPSVI